MLCPFRWVGWWAPYLGLHLPRPGMPTRLLVPGLSSLLWNKPQIHLEGGWVTPHPQQSCHWDTGGHICPAGLSPDLQNSQLCSTIGVSSPPGAFVAPSGTLRASQQRQSTQLSSHLLPLHCATEACRCHQQRVLSSSLVGNDKGWQQEPTILWGVLWGGWVHLSKSSYFFRSILEWNHFK